MRCGGCGHEIVCPHCHSQSLVKVESLPARTRGHRLPEGWMPDINVVEAMRQEFPWTDREWFRQQHDEFVDYWIAVPGQRGVKLDWNATWRNWIRRNARRHNGTQNGTLSTVDAKVSGWMELGRD